ncbi:hypothetical protein [Saccharothrix deserti]|uniref:hypothetical protein n=1 Tax=Saccharothrix deserti TaxID=2593674 RepID=UPI00131E44D2|nr:hypothetical protein [Saccharothrix deserti]
MNATTRRLRGAVLAILTTGMVLSATSGTANAAETANGGPEAGAEAADFPTQDPLQCTPFNSTADAREAADNAAAVVTAWAAFSDVPGAEELYRDYLTPGKFSPHRKNLNQIYSKSVTDQVIGQFRTAKETGDAVSGMVGGLKNKILTAPRRFGVEYDLRRVGLGRNVPFPGATCPPPPASSPVDSAGWCYRTTRPSRTFAISPGSTR